MEVSGEREELTAQVRGDLLHKNVVSKGTAMARAGNIKGAQAIMSRINMPPLACWFEPEPKELRGEVEVADVASAPPLR